MDVLTAVSATLGEGPIWHAADRSLYWVDILGQRVFRHDPHTGVTAVVHEGTTVTALAETSRGGLLFMTPRGLQTLDDGVLSTILELSLPDTVRTNDGKCDPWGRVWLGTMDLEARRPIAELMRYDGSGLSHPIRGLTLSNGLGWSPSGDVFYHVDSRPGVLYAHDHDPGTGEISGRRVLVDFTDTGQTPDGLALDIEGNVWLAMWNGWGVRVFDPSGAEVGRFELPVQRPTCVVFGGDDLDVLYVSTAREGLDAADLAGHPAAGEILALDPGVKGMPGGVFSPG